MEARVKYKVKDSATAIHETEFTLNKIFKLELVDEQGRLRLAELSTSEKLNNQQLREIIRKELPGWQLLCWRWV